MNALHNLPGINTCLDTEVAIAVNEPTVPR